MKRTKQAILKEIRAIKASEASYSHQVIRADPYSKVATAVLAKCPNSPLFDNLTFKEVRALVKYPVMTTFYNSQAQPKEVFGEDTPELEAFYTTLQELFPGAMKVMEAINARWDSKATYHEWPTPDGAIAHVKTIVQNHGTISAGGMEFKYAFNANEASDVGTPLVANYIHSLDGFVVRYVVEHADFEVLHVHDELKCHPNNCSRMIELYLEAFEVIATKGVEQFQEFCGQDYGIDTRALLEGMKTTEYSLC